MSRSGSMWRTMLFGIGGALTVLLIGFGLIVVNLLGGLDDLLNGDGPHEDDPEVVAAREAATLDPLASTVRTALPASPVGEAETSSSCTVGEHNWKIDDDYDLVCDLIQVEVLAQPDKDSFRADMVALDAALQAQGWSPSRYFGMERVLVDYWDELVTPHRPAYSMNDLPAASYELGVGGERRALAVDWDEPAEDGYTVSLTQSLEYFRK